MSITYGSEQYERNFRLKLAAIGQNVSDPSGLMTADEQAELRSKIELSTKNGAKGFLIFYSQNTTNYLQTDPNIYGITLVLPDVDVNNRRFDQKLNQFNAFVTDGTASPQISNFYQRISCEITSDNALNKTTLYFCVCDDNPIQVPSDNITPDYDPANSVIFSEYSENTVLNYDFNLPNEIPSFNWLNVIPLLHSDQPKVFDVELTFNSAVTPKIISATASSSGGTGNWLFAGGNTGNGTLGTDGTINIKSGNGTTTGNIDIQASVAGITATQESYLEATTAGNINFYEKTAGAEITRVQMASAPIGGTSHILQVPTAQLAAYRALAEQNPNAFLLKASGDDAYLKTGVAGFNDLVDGTFTKTAGNTGQAVHYDHTTGLFTNAPEMKVDPTSREIILNSADAASMTAAGVAVVESTGGNASLVANVDTNVTSLTGNNIITAVNGNINATAQGSVNLTSNTGVIENTVPTGLGFVDIDSGAEGTTGYATRIDTRDQAVPNVEYVKTKVAAVPLPTADPVLDIQNFAPEFPTTLGLQGTSICTAANLQVDTTYNQVEGAGGRWYEGVYMFEGTVIGTAFPVEVPLPQGSDPFRQQISRGDPIDYLPRYNDVIVRCKYGGDKILYAKMNSTVYATAYTPSNNTGTTLGVYEPVYAPFGTLIYTLQLYGDVSIGVGVGATTFSEPLSNFLYTHQLQDLDTNEVMKIPLTNALSWQKYGSDSAGMVVKPVGANLQINGNGTGVDTANCFVRATTGNDNKMVIDWSGAGFFAYLSYTQTSIYTQNFLVRTKIENAVSPPSSIQYNVSATTRVTFRDSTDPTDTPITSWTQAQVDANQIYGTVDLNSEDFSVTFALTDTRLGIVGSPITRTFAVKGGYCRPPPETSEAIFEAAAGAASTKASKDPVTDPDTGTVTVGSTDAAAGMIARRSWAEGNSAFLAQLDGGTTQLTSNNSQGLELYTNPPTSSAPITLFVGSGTGSIIRQGITNKSASAYATEITGTGTNLEAIPNKQYIVNVVANLAAKDGSDTGAVILGSQDSEAGIQSAASFAFPEYFVGSTAAGSTTLNSYNGQALTLETKGGGQFQYIPAVDATSYMAIATNNKSTAQYITDVGVDDSAVMPKKYIDDQIATASGDRPYIDIYKSSPYASSISVATPTPLTYVAVADATLTTHLASSEFANVNGVITYTSATTRRFRITCTAGLYGDVNDEKIFFKVVKNGNTGIEDWKTGLSYSKNTASFAERLGSISYIEELANGDTLQLYVAKDTGSTIATVNVNQTTICVDSV